MTSHKWKCFKILSKPIISLLIIQLTPISQEEKGGLLGEGKWPRPWLVINKRKPQTSSAVGQTAGDRGVDGEGLPSAHVHNHLVLTASTAKKEKESKSD